MLTQGRLPIVDFPSNKREKYHDLISSKQAGYTSTSIQNPRTASFPYKSYINVRNEKTPIYGVRYELFIFFYEVTSSQESHTTTLRVY